MNRTAPFTSRSLRQTRAIEKHLGAARFRPLVLVPGAGAELYRGLGSVVIGGLSLSAVLTLAIVPPLLSMFMSSLEPRRRAAVRSAEPAGQPAE